MAKSFDKFINKPVKGAKIKEAFRQEKKAAVRERREAIEKRFEEKRQQKQAMYEARQQQGTDSRKPTPRNPAKKESTGPRAKSGGSKVGKKWEKPIRSQTPREEKPFQKPTGQPATDRRQPAGANRKPPVAIKKAAPTNNPQEQRTTPQAVKPSNFTKNAERKPAAKPASNKPTFAKPTFEKPFPKTDRKVSAASDAKGADFKKVKASAPRDSKPAKSAVPVKPTSAKTVPAIKGVEATDTMPLNKFLAHAGICSRRDAADKVRQGLASVNGEVVTEPAFKVSDTDVVTYEGKKVKRSNNLVYILLNKPKDTITTAEDPQGRKTVMDIIRPATQERVYPVGRLDRNTSGVLLLTNDGDLAQQLSHPSFEVRKIYEVRLDKALTKADFDKIVNGLTLEDGPIHADSLAYSDPKDKTIIGIEIHSGRNRIVRRMFEHLGYDVRGLDRVMYANLTKKNVERGHWRFLMEKEVRLLKYFNKSKKTN